MSRTQVGTRLLGAGSVLQVVSFMSTTLASTSSTMSPSAGDYTNTQGAEFMALAITPKFATSILLVELSINLTNTVSTAALGYALFRDSTVNAVAGGVYYAIVASNSFSVPLVYSGVSGSTATTTFKFRAGGTAGNTYINSYGTGAFAASEAKSSMVITEIAA